MPLRELVPVRSNELDVAMCGAALKELERVPRRAVGFLREFLCRDGTTVLVHHFKPPHAASHKQIQHTEPADQFSENSFLEIFSVHLCTIIMIN